MVTVLHSSAQADVCYVEHRRDLAPLNRGRTLVITIKCNINATVTYFILFLKNLIKGPFSLKISYHTTFQDLTLNVVRVASTSAFVLPPYCCYLLKETEKLGDSCGHWCHVHNKFHVNLSAVSNIEIYDTQAPYWPYKVALFPETKEWKAN